MDLCGKKIVKTEFGFPIKTTCKRPSVNGGYCSYHQKKHKIKMTPWGERKDHRPATLDDLLNGRYLKRKDIHMPYIFRYKRGVIQAQKKDEWVDTDMEINHELFCVKTY